MNREDEAPNDGIEPVTEASDGTEAETSDPRDQDDRNGGRDTVFGIDSERLATSLRWGVLFVLGVVILVAGGGLYSSLGAIIDVWVADRYQPIARAGLNFTLLCGAVAGVVATLRRL